MTPIAETRDGKLEGTERDGIRVFRGIPYAAPPTGPRRWLPPQPVEPWAGIRPAKRYGFVAPQPERPAESPLATLGTELGPESEDCLTLNVWTPGLDDARRPVLVWIHGGGFRRGTGSSPLYAGGRLARRGDVVVVTLNYRLGPLGFLNLAEITGGRIPATGNEGLLDQIAALEWVRENIAAFGGNPDEVTIFGESAGGMSVGALLGMPGARGLFRRAIPQSGAASTAHSLSRARRVAERLLERLGADAQEPETLRAIDPKRLIAETQKLSLSGDREIGGMICQPVIDGRVLPKLAIEAVRGGSADGVPVLVGTTLDEWNLFLAMDPRGRNLDAAGLAGRVARSIAEADLRPIADAYHEIRAARGADTSPPALWSALETDRVFRMPALHLAEALGARGTPAFVYCFDWPSPLFGGRLGACHAIDLGFVWGAHDISPGTEQFFGSGPAAKALAEATQDAWLGFARTGDPSCARLGTWPAYTTERRATMILGEKCRLVDAQLEAERRAWDGVADGSTLGRL